ncbi:kinase-like protein, partial [Auricularia subglabra TFB-10046 SS5]
IVAPFMVNGNLLQYIKQRPDADRQGLLIQVSEAVHWLHACKDMVHGDLKCEKVLVNDEGNALLADFGLSTFVEKEASSVTTMTAIRNMNTLRFAAPELLLGFDDDDESNNTTRPRSKTCPSEVYAFGMLVLQV